MKWVTKNQHKDVYKKKRKNRNSRKFKSQLDQKTIDRLVEKQSKLHNEEKELLKKQEQMNTAPDVNWPQDDNNITYLKSESILTVEQELRESGGVQEVCRKQQVYHSKVLVSSIDAAILEGLNFIEHAPMIKKRRDNCEIECRLPARTELTPEYTLVLDLDETLVHWSISPFEGYDEMLEWIYISYRPYLIQFLEKVSQNFEVVIFTASEKEYATMVLDRIDPESRYIEHRLFRDSCYPCNGNYIKDLNVLGRDIDKTIIIDNSVIAFLLNIDNGIPIHSFCGDKQDTELWKIIEVIDYAVSLKHKSEEAEGEEAREDTINLREYLTSVFGLKERISFWQAQCLAHAKQNVSINI